MKSASCSGPMVRSEFHDRIDGLDICDAFAA